MEKRVPLNTVSPIRLDLAFLQVNPFKLTIIFALFYPSNLPDLNYMKSPT